MRSAPQDGGMMNTSLSSMLEGMELSPKAKTKESLTIATKDSIRKTKTTTAKQSKRGAKKGMPGLEESSMEHSLSDLMNITSTSFKSTPKESVSVFTTDSIGKKQKEGSTPKRSKRGAKKSENSDMERSLSDLLSDESELEAVQASGMKTKESPTVHTVDSIQREKMVQKPSKRGGKKPDSCSSKKAPPLSATLGKLGGPPKDFGRQADDNDTFCAPPGSGDGPLSHRTKLAAPTLRGGGGGGSKPSSSFGLTEDNSDSDDEDLFASFSGGSNPFRLPTYL